MAYSLLSFALILSFLVGDGVLAAPYASQARVQNGSQCATPRARKEWRSLTIPERKDYVRAVSCMMSKPPISKQHFPVVQNRYDDFVALHANSTGGGLQLNGFTGLQAMMTNPRGIASMMSSGIHGTGTFLPWHRYAIQIWEDALNEECGWNGGQPYWDWQLDTPEAGGEWLKSPLFDVESGFGGNGKAPNWTAIMPAFDPAPFAAFLPTGVTFKDLPSIIPGFEVMAGTGGGCIQDGPFKDKVVTIGPMGRMVPGNNRCLMRSFNPAGAHASANKRSIGNVLKSPTFAEFRKYMEAPRMITGQDSKGKVTVEGDGGLHNIGHWGVGGEMLDVFNSANDPLFWLHHTGLDRIWALWQEKDEKRLHNVDGTLAMFDMNPFTLDTPLWTGFAAPDQPVRKVMDTQNRDGSGILCYKYAGRTSEDYS